MILINLDTVAFDREQGRYVAYADALTEKLGVTVARIECSVGVYLDLKVPGIIKLADLNTLMASCIVLDGIPYKMEQITPASPSNFTSPAFNLVTFLPK